MSGYLWRSHNNRQWSRTPSPDDVETLAHLLKYYDTPGIVPPFSRIDPSMKQRLRQGSLLSLRTVWKLGALLASKSTEMATDFISHHIYGPKRPTWGIEMTIVSSFMRGMAKHSSLANIVTLRALMQIGGMAPLPSDALVTPVTFRVKKRFLPGILAEFDADEDGCRELSGEWVVGRRLWMRLQSDWRARRQSERLRKYGKFEDSVSNDNDGDSRKSKERVVLYLHGGAYYLCSAATHRLVTIPLSKHAGARVFALDYRLAPETRFPGPLHDAVSAYFRLIDDLKIPPENIIVSGDSAGGGLTLALLMYLRDHQFPMPSAAILMSPWVDLTMSCETWDSNSEFDVCPAPDPCDHLNPVYCYLGDGGIETYLTHPYASPLFGRFEGLPPLLIQSGEAEVLRDEITLLAHKATLHGVNVTHELYEDAVHVFQMLPFLPAARKAFESCRKFIFDILPTYEQKKGKSLGVIDEGQLDTEIGDKDKMKVVDGAGEEESVINEEIQKEDLPSMESCEEKEQLVTAVENVLQATAKVVAEEEESKDDMSWSYNPTATRSRNHSRRSSHAPMPQLASIISSPQLRKLELGVRGRSESYLDDEKLMEQSKRDGTSVNLSDGEEEDEGSGGLRKEGNDRKELLKELEERLRSALGLDVAKATDVAKVEARSDLERSWSSATLAQGLKQRTVPHPAMTMTVGRAAGKTLGPGLGLTPFKDGNGISPSDGAERRPAHRNHFRSQTTHPLQTPTPPCDGARTSTLTPFSTPAPHSLNETRRQRGRPFHPLTPMSTPNCLTPPRNCSEKGAALPPQISYFGAAYHPLELTAVETGECQNPFPYLPVPVVATPENSRVSNAPSWKRRNRALSHPNVTKLCEEWLTQGPANSTRSYANEPAASQLTEDHSDFQTSLLA